MSYIINPETNRRCTVGGAKYKNLVSRGIIENRPFGKLDRELTKPPPAKESKKEDDELAAITEKVGKIDLKRAQSMVVNSAADDDDAELDDAEVRKAADRILIKYFKLHGARLTEEFNKHNVRTAADFDKMVMGNKDLHDKLLDVIDDDDTYGPYEDEEPPPKKKWTLED